MTGPGNDDERGADDGTEPTQPISGSHRGQPDWGPPPQEQWGPGPVLDPAEEAVPTRPLPPFAAEHPGSQARAALPAWVWPAVAALALVVGLVGGGLGGALYQRADDGSARGLDPGTTRTVPPLTDDNQSVSAVARELLPSTVQVLAGSEDSEGGATGSGFVLDAEGHIVTNNHVVADAADDDGTIRIVDAEGNRQDATVVGRSRVYDLAVLRVEDPEALRPASLGSAEALAVGDPVVAFGAPLGLSQTVTSGIVSALDRPVTTGESDDDSSFINAVQTDAAINPGNSGGPLVNLAGQVVGVNSAIATTGGFLREAGNIGVGFAIPIEQVKTTADQILRTGEARYPVIGAQVQTGGAGDLAGARIDEVGDGTPAEIAGLRPDDVVIAVDGERITDGISLIVSIRTRQPGETVEFTLVRDGEEQKVEITLDSEVG